MKNFENTAIIAGKGILPIEVYHQLEEKGEKPIVVALQEYFSGGMEIPHVKFSIYDLGKIFRYLKSCDVKKVVLAGKVERVSLNRLLLSWQGIKLFLRIMKGGLSDNSILNTIISFIEKNGFQVISYEDIMEQSKVTRGTVTKNAPSKKDLEYIELGWQKLKAIAEMDIGQALVIQEDLVLGVEAAEGTNELIKRCSSLGHENKGNKILLKMVKPNQETRVDVPCIGEDTIELLAKNAFKGIAIEASKVIVLNKEKTIKKAENNSIFTYGY